MNMNRLIPPPDCDLATWLSSVVYDAIRDAKTAGLSDSDASVLLDIIARNTRSDDRLSRTVTLPRVDWRYVIAKLHGSGETARVVADEIERQVSR